MFGHQNNLNPQQDNSAAVAGPQPDTAPAVNASDTTTADAASFSAPTTLPSPTVATPSVASDDPVTVAPTSAPPVDTDSDTAGDYIMTDPPQTATTSAPSVQASSTPSAPAPEPVSDSDDLLELKQGALQQLTPLLDHLDQTPEEKFRTTMMMIQAADNQALLKTAYDAAQQITDEKARAQALLDVVNEINYFTQQSSDDTASTMPTAL